MIVKTQLNNSCDRSLFWASNGSTKIIFMIFVKYLAKNSVTCFSPSNDKVTSEYLQKEVWEAHIVTCVWNSVNMLLFLVCLCYKWHILKMLVYNRINVCLCIISNRKKGYTVSFHFSCFFFFYCKVATSAFSNGQQTEFL